MSNCTYLMRCRCKEEFLLSLPLVAPSSQQLHKRATNNACVMQHPIAAIVSFLMTGDTHLLSDACGDELVEGDGDQNALSDIEEKHDAVGDGQSGGRESEVEPPGSVEIEILRAITDHIPWPPESAKGSLEGNILPHVSCEQSSSGHAILGSKRLRMAWAESYADALLAAKSASGAVGGGMNARDRKMVELLKLRKSEFLAHIDDAGIRLLAESHVYLKLSAG